MSGLRNKRTLREKRRGGEQGIALLIAMTAISILTVTLADMHEETGTAYAVALDGRDRLRAQYLATSGVNLTRLLISIEPQVRQVIAPIFQMALGAAPPQVPVWTFAGEILKPFCDFEGSMKYASKSGLDLKTVKGMGQMNGTCEIMAVPENSKFNVNNPMFLDSDAARNTLASQLYAMMGGKLNPSPYDPLFQKQDVDGIVTNRGDVISHLIDWWDYDLERTVYDPVANRVSVAGVEDDVYKTYEDPYRMKNAPLDSLEELRLIRGFNDDFWATFVQPNPTELKDDVLTVYGSGSVNPNEAPPQVLIARVCGAVPQASLCLEPLEAAKFTQLLSTIRAILPIPWFRAGADFVNFLEGKGGPRDLYPLMQNMLGAQNPMVFRPLVFNDKQRPVLGQLFTPKSDIFMIRVIGRSQKSTIALKTVVNFSDKWSPPPPNAGTMTPFGVLQYWREE